MCHIRLSTFYVRRVFHLYILHFQWVFNHFQSIIFNSLDYIDCKLITTITRPNPILSNYNLIHLSSSLWVWIKSESTLENHVISSRILSLCSVFPWWLEEGLRIQQGVGGWLARKVTPCRVASKPRFRSGFNNLLVSVTVERLLNLSAPLFPHL